MRKAPWMIAVLALVAAMVVGAGVYSFMCQADQTGATPAEPKLSSTTVEEPASRLPEPPDEGALPAPGDGLSDTPAAEQASSAIEEAVAAEVERQEQHPDESPPENQDWIIAELAQMERDREAGERQTKADIPRVAADLAKVAGANYEGRAEILRKLCEYSPDARRVYLDEIKAYLSDPFPLVQVSAAGVVYELDRDEKALRILIECLDDVDSEVRHSAAWEMHRSTGQEPAMIEPLIAALSDSHYRVRQQAAEALNRKYKIAQAAVPALLAALDDEDLFVRSRSAYALSQIRPLDRRVVPAIGKLLTDPKETVRRKTYSALGNIGRDDERVLPLLLGLLDGDDNESIVLALGALHKLHEADAVPYAQRLQDSEDEDVARAARCLLISVEDNPSFWN